jgi:hypothetical protein
MATKRKPKSPPAPYKPTPCKTTRLANPAVLTTSCIPILEQELGYAPLTFSQTAKRFRGVTRYELVGSYQQRATARDEYLVHPLTDSTADRYWAAVTLDFQYSDPNHDLVSIQIVVFKGDAFGPKQPMLRAEWHCSPADLQAPHAQPHWHAYTSEEPAPFSFGEPVPFEAPTGSSREPLSFHFAMASKWQTDGPGAHTLCLSDSTMLVKWLSGCLKYIRSQLQ